MEKPDLQNCTEKQYEKWYWSDYNGKCRLCTNKCKQSHVVEVSCSKYTGIKEEMEVDENQ